MIFTLSGNDVITWRGVKNFNRKPQLVGGGGGGNFGPIDQKSAYETVQFLQSILDIQTYIYKGALRSRSLRDGSLPHKGRSATFVRLCSALRASKRPLRT